MHASQITARVSPELKKAFTKTAKLYGLPVSGLLSMFMRMVVERKFIPEFNVANTDNLRTAELEDTSKKAWEDFNEGKTIPLAVVLREEGLIK